MRHLFPRNHPINEDKNPNGHKIQKDEVPIPKQDLETQEHSVPLSLWSASAQSLRPFTSICFRSFGHFVLLGVQKGRYSHIRARKPITTNFPAIRASVPTPSAQTPGANWSAESGGKSHHSDGPTLARNHRHHLGRRGPGGVGRAPTGSCTAKMWTESGSTAHWLPNPISD